MADRKADTRGKTTYSTRRTGRPVKGLANLRERVLDAALVAYSRLGEAATQSRDVARIAGVAPALVNYYFKGREGLAMAVAEERLDPLLDRIWAPVQDESLPEDKMLMTFLHESLRVAREYSWFAPLWIREHMTEGGLLHRHNERVRSRGEVRKLHARIRRGQKLGLIPARYSPELFMWSIIGLALFPFAAEPALVEGHISKSVVKDEKLNHSEELLRRALAIQLKPARTARRLSRNRRPD